MVPKKDREDRIDKIQAKWNNGETMQDESEKAMMDIILGYIGRNSALVVLSNGNSTDKPAQEESWRTVFSKLHEFRHFEDDWDGQGGLAPRQINIDAMVEWLEPMQSLITPPQSVIPGVAGELYVMWHGPDWYLSAEIENPTVLEWMLSGPNRPVEQWDMHLAKPAVSSVHP